MAKDREQNQVMIRIATCADAEAMLAIYAPYVENTAITFEYEVPTVEEFTKRIECILEKYPVLVAEKDEKVIGYAYADTFKGRAAFNWAVETSIYMDEACKGIGVGRSLYEKLEELLQSQNIVNLNACIAYPIEEDETLTKDSVYFHEKMGYRMVGKFRKCGYKFGRWYHMVWMEKHIGAHKTPQAPVRWFRDFQVK